MCFKLFYTFHINTILYIYDDTIHLQTVHDTIHLQTSISSVSSSWIHKHPFYRFGTIHLQTFPLYIYKIHPICFLYLKTPIPVCCIFPSVCCCTFSNIHSIGSTLYNYKHLFHCYDSIHLQTSISSVWYYTVVNTHFIGTIAYSYKHPFHWFDNIDLQTFPLYIYKHLSHLSVLYIYKHPFRRYDTIHL